jgi:hypothetical protein
VEGTLEMRRRFGQQAQVALPIVIASETRRAINAALNQMQWVTWSA